MSLEALRLLRPKRRCRIHRVPTRPRLNLMLRHRASPAMARFLLVPRPRPRIPIRRRPPCRIPNNRCGMFSRIRILRRDHCAQAGLAAQYQPVAPPHFPNVNSPRRMRRYGVDSTWLDVVLCFRRNRSRCIHPQLNDFADFPEIHDFDTGPTLIHRALPRTLGRSGIGTCWRKRDWLGN
jgi:hypothetical protein